MDHYFTIYQYKTEESKNIGISASISFRGLNVLVSNMHVFHRSKMTASKLISTGLKMLSYELRYFNFADTPWQ